MKSSESFGRRELSCRHFSSRRECHAGDSVVLGDGFRVVLMLFSFQCQYSNKSTSTEDNASNECGRITEKVQLHIDSKPFVAVSAN